MLYPCPTCAHILTAIVLDPPYGLHHPYCTSCQTFLPPHSAVWMNVERRYDRTLDKCRLCGLSRSIKHGAPPGNRVSIFT